MELMKQRFDFAKASAKQLALIEKVYSFGNLFEDMLFRPHTIASDYLAVFDHEGNKVYDSIWPELDCFDYEWFNFRVISLKQYDCCGLFSGRSLTLSIDSDIFNENDDRLDDVLLHEMIHLHELVFDKYLPSFYKEAYFLALYSDLKEKVPDLDDLLFQCCHISRSEETALEGGSHGLLFALKSFDLDIRTGKELGTIFGYSRTNIFRGVSGEK